MKQNSVQLIGYLGKDPEIKVFNNGLRRACLRVATHYPLKAGSQKRLYATTWHNIVAWEQHAEYAERSFVKGSHILVDGSIIYNTYPDKEGHIRYTTEIKASSLINLDR